MIPLLFGKKPVLSRLSGPVFISVQQMAALSLVKQPFEPALKMIARAQTQLKEEIWWLYS